MEIVSDSIVEKSAQLKGWPEQVQAVKYMARIDKSQQPMLR